MDAVPQVEYHLFLSRILNPNILHLSQLQTHYDLVFAKLCECKKLHCSLVM